MCHLFFLSSTFFLSTFWGVNGSNHLPDDFRRSHNRHNARQAIQADQDARQLAGIDVLESNNSQESSILPNWTAGPCLTNDGSIPLLHSLRSSGPTSPLHCTSLCAIDGYKIAAITNGNECWCGNTLNFISGEQLSAREVATDQCNIPCEDGNSGTSCGGLDTLQLFALDGILDTYGFGFTRANSSPMDDIDLPSPPLTSFDSPLGVLPNPLDPSLNNDADLYSKKVIAHHIVGNTYPYTRQTWISDLTLAKNAGIDGFVLNVGDGGPKSWQSKQVESAFAATESVGGVGLIFSFDMSALPCADQRDAQTLRDYLATWGPHAGHLTIPPRTGSNMPRIVVSTFAGEYCTFGRGSVRDGWLSVLRDPSVLKAIASAGREIGFVPSWFARVESRRQEFGDAVQGDFHWNGGWPAGDYDINWDSDRYHQQYNPGPLYMAAVSPWFFTHYGPDSYNKNWIYRGDDWLYASRWELLIEHRAEVDLVEIVTWNDYGESSYIGPVEGDQPNSQAWVNDFPHHAFLSVTAYYSQAFKSGNYPDITKDVVLIWSRPHPHTATASRDSVGRPEHSDWTDDYLWAMVLAVDKAKLTLTSGTNSARFEVTPGVNKFKLPNAPGQIRAVLRRGDTIVDVNPGKKFIYTNSPRNYNFNFFATSG